MRGGEAVGLAYGEDDGGDDGEQGDRRDDQQRAADLAADRRTGLLDRDDLVLLALGLMADDVADGLLADLDRGLAGDLDTGVALVADLVPEDLRGDPFVADDAAVHDARQLDRLGLHAFLGAGADRAGLDDDEGDAEDRDDHEDDGEGGLDETAAHGCPPGGRVFLDL